uniref:LuxR C-terminal-related transcriptional regulator n=1 Tax=Edaphosphingomonas laterariae TaxID=861865 RepID=UPI001FE4C094|nr:response regulator transcription factor [Sphingomonas laterariae]
MIDYPEPEHQVAALDKMLALAPSARVIVLAECFDRKTAAQLFRCGVHGYITKSMKCVPLIAALRLAATGERIVPAGLLELLDRPAGAPVAEHDLEDARLSPRELDVLCCLLAGHSNKMIGRRLGVCEATVKVHVKAILRKLNVHNRTQAAIWASSRGLAGPDAEEDGPASAEWERITMPSQASVLSRGVITPQRSTAAIGLGMGI